MTDRHSAALRIGVIVPADNVVTEPELYGLGLHGVSFHIARLATEDRKHMRADALRAAATLALAGVDAVAYACGETSAISPAQATAFLQTLAEIAGAPAISATSATVELLAARSATRVVLVTPYQPRYGEQVEEAYRQRGVELHGAIHHHFRTPIGQAGEWFATNRQEPPAVRWLLGRALTAGAESVVFPATNLRALSILGTLAADAGRPVITANQALAWWCLRRSGRDAEAAAVGEGRA